MKPWFFKFDKEKAIQTVIWFLQKHGGQIDKMKLLSLIFLADHEHLLLHGRPVLGGIYKTNHNGIFNSNVCKLLDSDFKNTWIVNDSEKVVLNKAVSLDEDEFSKSDLDVINAIDIRHGTSDRHILQNELQKLYSYQQYPETINFPYESFFLDCEENKFDLIDIIIDHQEAERCLKED